MYSVVQQMFQSRFPLSKLLKNLSAPFFIMNLSTGERKITKLSLLELRTLFLWINKLRVFVLVITHWKQRQKEKKKAKKEIK